MFRISNTNSKYKGLTGDVYRNTFIYLEVRMMSDDGAFNYKLQVKPIASATCMKCKGDHAGPERNFQDLVKCTTLLKCHSAYGRFGQTRPERLGV